MISSEPGQRALVQCSQGMFHVRVFASIFTSGFSLELFGRIIFAFLCDDEMIFFAVELEAIYYLRMFLAFLIMLNIC